ncbi:MAG: NUDIX domain-containing protein [bacterium]
MKYVTKEELSAGGVVYRKQEFLIGKHSGYHKWVLPKGLVEKGEGPILAAIREVEEEVGVKARIAEIVPLKTVEYYYMAELGVERGEGADGTKTKRRVKKYQEEGGRKTRVHKKVIFYLMELEEDLEQAGWEMEERRWVSYEEGKKMLAFEGERRVLEEAFRKVGAPAET